MKKLIAMLAFTPLMAHAEFMTGNTLLQMQRSTSTVENMVALGYVQGVFDTTQHIIHCASGNLTAGQVNDIARQYLEVNPQTRNKTADILLSDAYQKTWPCPTNSRRGRSGA
jgi:hypothetical protein